MEKKKIYAKPTVSVIRLDREIADTKIGVSTSEDASGDYEVLGRSSGFLDDEWADDEEEWSD